MQKIPDAVELVFDGAGLKILDAIAHQLTDGGSAPDGCERWNVRFRYDHGSEDWALVECLPAGGVNMMIDGVAVHEWTQQIRAKEAANVIYDYCAQRLRDGDVLPLTSIRMSFRSGGAADEDVAPGLRWLKQNGYVRQLGPQDFHWTGKRRKG